MEKSPELSTGKLLAAALTGLAALVWTANCVVLAVSFQRDGLPQPLFALDLVCAAIWWLAFGLNLLHWRRAVRAGETDV